MSELVDKIRVSIAPDATPAERSAGAAACRCVLALIEPEPPASIPPNVIAQAVGMLKGMDLEQVLGVAIERLRAVTAARGDVAPAKPARSINFQLVPVPGALNGGT